MKFGKLGLFAAGVLFGTAGIKLLSSKDAKKVYTHVTTIRENCGDILADAKAINERRAAEEAAETIKDTAE